MMGPSLAGHGSSIGQYLGLGSVASLAIQSAILRALPRIVALSESKAAADALRAMIKRMLEPDPSKRPTFPELLEELTESLTQNLHRVGRVRRRRLAVHYADVGRALPLDGAAAAVEGPARRRRVERR